MGGSKAREKGAGRSGASGGERRKGASGTDIMPPGGGGGKGGGRAFFLRRGGRTGRRGARGGGRGGRFLARMGAVRRRDEEAAERVSGERGGVGVFGGGGEGGGVGGGAEAGDNCWLWCVRVGCSVGTVELVEAFGPSFWNSEPRGRRQQQGRGTGEGVA